MAIFHAHTSYVSRSTGSSVCAHAAYISASKILEEHTGNVFDYQNKWSEVLHVSLFVPSSLKGFDSAEKVWNYVEEFEDRIAENRYGKQKDLALREKSLAAKERFLSTASTGFKMECALPVEFSSAEKIELSNRLAKELFLSRDLVVQYAIHDKEGNPHVHFVSSFRRVVDGDFSKRKVYYKSSDIKELRSKYADITNQYARELGYDFSIDHRSLEAQGVDREPTRHRGWYASFKMLEGSRIYQENEEIYDANQSLFMKDSDELLKQVIEDKTVFSREDLIRGLEKVVGGDVDDLEVLRQRLDGVDALDIKERIEKFGAFCDKALGCHMMFEEVKQASKANSAHKDYLEMRDARNAFAQEILGDVERYKWLMAKVGIRSETLYLMVRSDIAFHDGFFPFKVQEVPRDLRSGDMLNSLVKSYGETLDKAFVDLFNLTLIGEGVKHESLYMGEEDLQTQKTLSDLKERLAGEVSTRSLIDKIRYRAPEKLVEKAIKDQEALKGYSLSQVQVDAIKYLTGGRRLLGLEGKAGTGKTTVLKAVSDAYKGAGYRVIGTSFQGAAVGELSRSLGNSADGCYTLDRLNKSWRRIDSRAGRKEGARDTSLYEINSRTVIIVDEAGMSPSRLINPLLERAYEKGAKVILVGDPQQLGAIERGSYGRLLMEESFVMDDIRRQKNEGDRAASLSLSNGYVREALDHYAPNTTIRETSFSSKLNLATGVVGAIKDDIYGKSHGDQKHMPSVMRHMVLAFKNQDVQDLNHMIQNGLYSHGLIGDEEIRIFRGVDKLSKHDRASINTAIGGKGDLSYRDIELHFQESSGDEREKLEHKITPLMVRQGDKILFKRNHTFQVPGPEDKSFAVYNGNAGVVRSYDNCDNILTIEREEGDVVDIPLNVYTHFDLGYAVTISRSQGKTAPNTYVHLENTNKATLSQNLVYVALTRHEDMVQLYTSKEYLGGQELADKVRVSSPLTYADVVENKQGERNPKLDTMQTLYYTATKAKELWGEIQGDVRDGKYDLKDHPKLGVFHRLKGDRQNIASTILSDLKSYQPYLSAVSYTEKTLQRWAGKLEHVATDQDIQMASYRDAASKAAALWKEISNTGGVKPNHPAYKDFLELQRKRNELAYKLTSFGTPKTYNIEWREPSLMLHSKNEINRLQAHAQQYIEAQGKISAQHTLPQKNMDGFYDSLRASVDVEGFVEKALGPGKRSGDALRLGPRGHLSVDMNTGVWTNFKEGLSGSLLGSPTKPGLLSQSEGCSNASFKETLVFAKDFVKDMEIRDGIYRLLDQKKLPKKLLESDSVAASKRKAEATQLRMQALENEQSKKITLAKSYVQKTTPIKNTPADIYLRERGITIKTYDEAYQSVRYRDVPQRVDGNWITVPSMTAIIRDENNRIQGIQTTLLTHDGKKDTSQDIPRRIQGVLSSGFVLIQKDVDNTNKVILEEGVETALSLKEAGIKGEIRAVLGINNFKSQTGLEDKKVILAADNDQHKDNTNLDQTLKAAATTYNATIIMPETPGYDFNDVLQKEGIESVRASFGMIDPHAEEILSKIADLNPDFDIEGAREKILENKGEVSGLTYKYEKSFETRTCEVYKEFESERHAAKNLGELMDVFSKELSFALSVSENHPSMVKNNPHIDKYIEDYNNDPKFLENLQQHADAAQSLGVMDESRIMKHLIPAINMMSETNHIMSSCISHILKEIDQDRKEIQEIGSLEKYGQTFTSELEYLEHRLNDNLVNTYISEEHKNSMMKDMESLRESQDLEKSHGWGI